MDFQTKLTAFAIVVATSLMWLLAGFSVGGVAGALERAITLIRTSDTFRRVKSAVRARTLQLARHRP
jgi:hypothetical protein